MDGKYKFFILLFNFQPKFTNKKALLKSLTLTGNIETPVCRRVYIIYR